MSRIGWSHARRLDPIDVGQDPPITLGTDDPEHLTRREISLRWLVGTVVTGITSIALMGGALLAALDGRYVLEAATDTPTVEQLLGHARPEVGRKGDKVQPTQDTISHKRVIEVSTVTRVDDRDHIRTRPYAFVTAGLVQSRANLSPDIPSFDPQKLFEESPAEAEPVATDAIYDKRVDGEITISVDPFPAWAVDPAAAAFGFSDEEVEQTVREQVWFAGDRSYRVASAGPGLSFGEPGLATGLGAMTGPRITVIPENVSELVKSIEERAEEADERSIVDVVQDGDTLSKILLGAGLDAADVKGIDRVLRSGAGVDHLKPGQVIRLILAWDGPETAGDTEETPARHPVRFDLYDGETHLASVAIAGEGYEIVPAPADGPPDPALAEDAPTDKRNGPRPSLHESLYQTALDHDLPKDVLQALVRMFAFDVDFSSRVRAGDSVNVLYSLPEEGADSTTPPEILFASLTAGGVERRFYRFKSREDGGIDYFDETGRSAQKFLLRKPMARGVFRSGFGMRRHPILGYRKMHTGVDWAAPRGTPIYAAGNGTVLQAGWKAGYGRWVLIQHANGYQTGYAHQSKIAPGIEKGTTVRQGQVIGYVGTTGLSTGPHLHYEVLINRRPVDPLRIRLPRGRELNGDDLDTFMAERRRIDQLVDEARDQLPTRLAGTR